jgi:hypothetical protein
MTAAVRFKHRGLLAAVQRERAQAPACTCGCDAEAWRRLQAAAKAADDQRELGCDPEHVRMGRLKPWERFHITYAREIALACWVLFGLVVAVLKP